METHRDAIFVFALCISFSLYFKLKSGIVGRICPQFLHNRAFCEESTKLTGCVDFDTSMNIRYGGISEINTESQKVEISDIFIYISITEKNVKISR